MKAYFVRSWSGEYEQYGEHDQKYFLHMKAARNYEKRLQKEKLTSDNEQREIFKHNPFLRDGIENESGVLFDEIEVNKELE